MKLAAVLSTGLVGAVLTAGSAWAANPTPPGPMASMAAGFDWGGLYFGAGGGTAWGTAYGFGAQIGYNVIRGSFLVGVESRAVIGWSGSTRLLGDSLSARAGLLLGASQQGLLFGVAGVGLGSTFVGNVYTAGGGFGLGVSERVSLFAEARAWGRFEGTCCGLTLAAGVNIHR